MTPLLVIFSDGGLDVPAFDIRSLEEVQVAFLRAKAERGVDLGIVPDPDEDLDGLSAEQLADRTGFFLLSSGSFRLDRIDGICLDLSPLEGEELEDEPQAQPLTSPFA